MPATEIILQIRLNLPTARCALPFAHRSRRRASESGTAAHAEAHFLTNGA